MRSRFGWMGGLALGVGLALGSGPAHAVITAAIPLKRILVEQPLIFTARVESVDPMRPAMVLQVAEKIRGDLAFDRMPVNMTGDSDAKKDMHTAAMFKRLDRDVPVVFFAGQRGKTVLAFGYTNGTWFQLLGRVGDEPGKVTWAFTHCEPYLRRTFKGTTAEFLEVVRDALAGKKDPPELDEKAEPGLGPELPAKKGARLTGGPLFGVIPTFVIMGPLALLAALFPAVFGGLALFMRRWLVFLSVACTISTLWFLQMWLGTQYLGAWLGSAGGFWIIVTLLALAGVLWSGRRHRAAQRLGLAAAPGRGERISLAILSLVGLLGVLWAGLVFYPADWWAQGWWPERVVGWRPELLLQVPGPELLILLFGVWAAAVYLFYQRATASSSTSPLPTELVALWAVVFGAANFGILQAAGNRSSGDFSAFGDQHAAGPRTARPRGTVWTFEVEGNGSIISSPLVTADRVYIGAIQGGGLSQFGVLYCLDRDTGKVLWQFDDEGELKQLYSTPCLADGRLYFGEGLHEHRGCRFFCVDAATGAKIWQFETGSHTESSPAVADGKVFFGAGDDGVYCLDAVSGQKIWQFQPGLHVDANPLVVGDRLYAGSGVSKMHSEKQLFCLNTADGRPHWQVAAPLPAWGSPSARGGLIYFGLGNGRLNQSAREGAAGAVLCVEADTGRRIWQYDVPDAVLMQPAADAYQLYFGSRDGNAYCLDRHDGRLRWKRALGSPLVTSLAAARCTCCDATTGLLVVAGGGQVACLDPVEGAVQWTFDVAGGPGWTPTLFSAPAVMVRRDGEVDRRLYIFGAGLASELAGSRGRLYCLEDEY